MSLRRGRLPLADKIAACERVYRAEGLPVVFRIPSILEETELDAVLAVRGYGKGGKTSIRLCDLTRFDHPGQAELTAMPTDAWLETFARFDGMSAAERATHRAIVEATPYAMAYAACRDGEAIAAVGAAVLQDRFVYLNAIATDATRRRRGFGRNAVAALLQWAKQRGAAWAHLPVAKDNVAGLALYNRLGFGTELYRYHYRVLAGA
jgi:ribosomal protein S18 acetylase RimI-like enzyme